MAFLRISDGDTMLASCSASQCWRLLLTASTSGVEPGNNSESNLEHHIVIVVVIIVVVVVVD